MTAVVRINEAERHGGARSKVPARPMRMRVRGIGPVFPGSIGVEALAAADPATEPAHAPGWFDADALIGKRGHKYYTEAGRMALAGIELARNAAGLQPEDIAGEGIGLTLGTNFAAHSMLIDIERVVEHEGVEALSPLMAPLFSINLSACLAGIRAGIQGFNVTLADPVVAGLNSFVFARLALTSGEAQRVFAGAAEGDGTPDGAGTPATRGAACLFLLEEARGNAAPAIVAACSGRMNAGGETRLATLLSGALPASGMPLSISVTGVDPGARSRARDFLCRVATTMKRSHAISDCFTDNGIFGAASPLFPLARALARPRDALVAAVSPGGAITIVATSAGGAA